MDPLEIEQLNHLEKSYWWHIGRRYIISAILKKYLPINKKQKILDFGCGTGGNFKLLQQFGEVKGADISQEAVEFCQKKGWRDVKTIKLGESLNGKYDLITAFDVLEHIRDDNQQLKIWQQALNENGFICLTVPAYRFLWSEHDEALQHVRRYVASELRVKIYSAGFDVIRISYAVTFTFPLILLYRFFRGFFPKSYLAPKTSYVILPGFLNSIFVRLISLESIILQKINLPFGTSIIVIAKKDGRYN